MAAISTSWEKQHFDGAVRDAFILLERVLRELGNVDPEMGLSGDRLVASLLAPSSRTSLTLPNDGFMGQLTRGEREGAYFYFRGVFLLFRNATAHRTIPYSASEAEDIIHVVNVCLRMLPTNAGAEHS